MHLIFSCEHGGNNIPNEFASIFTQHQKVLQTHRGYDIGALSVYQYLIKKTGFWGHYSTTSRLLIELNRSLHHQHLFSEFSKKLSTAQKQVLIAQYYLPYRNKVEGEINSLLKTGSVWHISIHSFTPILNNNNRNADIGLLYNPNHGIEKQICKKLQLNILLQNPELKIRFNYPYKGTADGFTVYLRKRFGKNYQGIELEINQKFMVNNYSPAWLTELLHTSIIQTLHETS